MWDWLESQSQFRSIVSCFGGFYSSPNWINTTASHLLQYFIITPLIDDIQQRQNIIICSRTSPVLISFDSNRLVLVLGLLDLSLAFFFLFSVLFLLFPNGFQISGNEQVNHLVPLLILLELAPQDEHFSGQQPEDHGDGLGLPIAAGDDHIDEVQGSVGVAQGDGGDVDVGGLDDGLAVGLGVSHDEDPGLLELLGDLVGEGTGNPAGRGAGGAAGVLAELVDSPLAVLLGADDDDLAEVGDGGDYSGCELDFIEGLIHLEDVVADGISALNVPLHVVIDFAGTQVHLCRQQSQDIFLLGFVRHSPQNCNIYIIYKILIKNQPIPTFTPDLFPAPNPYYPLLYPFYRPQALIQSLSPHHRSPHCMQPANKFNDLQQEQLQVQAPPRHFGNYIIIARDGEGEPWLAMGPHWYIFVLAFVVTCLLFTFMLYSIRDQLTQVWKWVLGVSSLLFACSYLSIGLMSPGFAKPVASVAAITTDAPLCQTCMVLRTQGTFHCTDCNVCIDGYDHHCPWVGKCVGRRNLKSFYFFLVMIFGHLILCFVGTLAANGAPSLNGGSSGKAVVYG